MKHKNIIEFRVSGPRALFTDPLTKIGGEKFSYSVPTYQALKGITESIYWKPTLIWVIDEVRIMNPIETQSIGVRPIKYNGGNDLATYTYLTNVDYKVRAHFVWNEMRPDLKKDWNENKHYFISKRMVELGGRRDIFLGTRECQGYVEPCVFDEGEGAYDNTPSIPLGVMFHSFSYPGECGGDLLKAHLWFPKMENGKIRFCLTENCPINRKIHKWKADSFTLGINTDECDMLAEELGYSEDVV
jgi:CRISPR-associated protein Cas5d